jgi:protein gp37
MSDLFHEGVPFEFVDKVFAVMALTPQHTYQILTKRPERMAEYLNETWQPRTDLAKKSAAMGARWRGASRIQRSDA